MYPLIVFTQIEADVYNALIDICFMEHSGCIGKLYSRLGWKYPKPQIEDAVSIMIRKEMVVRATEDVCGFPVDCINPIVELEEFVREPLSFGKNELRDRGEIVRLKARYQEPADGPCFSGTTPGQGEFEVRQAEDGFCLFVVGPEGDRYERFGLSWWQAITDLRGLGFIN